MSRAGHSRVGVEVPALGLLPLAARGGNPGPVGVRSLVPAWGLVFTLFLGVLEPVLPLFGPGPEEGRPWPSGRSALQRG